MEQPHSDALVVFGASGDLPGKKIFPALQSMVHMLGWTCRLSRSLLRIGIPGTCARTTLAEQSAGEIGAYQRLTGEAAQMVAPFGGRHNPRP